MSTQPQTWHYGLVARWWAEFSEPGPEIEYFQRHVEAGQPALDLACGTGRLLIPYLKAGLDVDGCDISPDMIACCREAAEREGLTPNLYAQAMHELDLPRRYRTIFVCGGWGLGSSREQDAEALRRIFAHLEPGGLLVLDNEVPYVQLGDVAVLDEGGARGASASPARAGSGASARLGRGRVRAPQPASSTSIRSHSRRRGRCWRRCGGTASSSPRRSIT